MTSLLLPTRSPGVILLALAASALSPCLAIPRPLGGTDWSLRSFRPAGANETIPVLPSTTVTAIFGDDGTQLAGTLTGSAGCNSYFGTFSVDLSTSGVVINKLGWTEMWCLGPEGIMEQESEYLKALHRDFSFSIYGHKLELYDEEGNLILDYVPLSGGQDDSAPSPPGEEDVPLSYEQDERTSTPIEEDGCADVMAATAKEVQSSGGASTWTFSATVSSPYEVGWDKYADAFEVRTTSGEVLGTRILLHPHVNEQPFTRSLSGVVIPPEVDSVIIFARDSVEGYCGVEFELELRPSAPTIEQEDESPELDDVPMDCSLCTSYYPNASTTSPISERGEKAPLTMHVCGQEVTTGCCRPYRPTRQENGSNACGVHWEGQFLYPCANCTTPGESAESDAQADMLPFSEVSSSEVAATSGIAHGFAPTAIVLATALKFGLLLVLV